jgi:hypothetical protein
MAAPDRSNFAPHHNRPLRASVSARPYDAPGALLKAALSSGSEEAACNDLLFRC